MIAPIWLADSLDDAIYLKLNRKDSVVGESKECFEV